MAPISLVLAIVALVLAIVVAVMNRTSTPTVLLSVAIALLAIIHVVGGSALIVP